MVQGEQTWQHTTVLLHEAVDALVNDPAGVYLDGTFGRGGHSRLILQRLAPAGRLIALDRDPEAVAHATSGADAITDPEAIVYQKFDSSNTLIQAKKKDGTIINYTYTKDASGNLILPDAEFAQKWLDKEVVNADIQKSELDNRQDLMPEHAQE